MERRRAPAANRRYRQRRFWDALYRQEGAEPREWLGGLSRFLPQLEAELRPGDRILVLGCGNSALSHDLHELGYTDVTSIDFSPACIDTMRARYARCPGLRWAVMDIRALAFPDATFDVVLEKGTLDVLMVEETDPWDVSPQAAAAMHRVLAEVRDVGSRAGGHKVDSIPILRGRGVGCRAPPHHPTSLGIPQPVPVPPTVGATSAANPAKGHLRGSPHPWGWGTHPITLSPGRQMEQGASLAAMGPCWDAK
uniref:EEF1A lysine methyltransferase 4 n=1 Tax=Falco tinnunculus TaxID=100819 RepID=A0A8C4XIY5_FALTI